MLKLLFRIVVVVGLMVVALALVFAAIIGIDSIGAAGRLAAVTNASIVNDDGSVIRAYVARPATPGPHPAVIMLHEFWGVRQDIVGKANDLAARGYLVIAPDVYGGRATNIAPSAIYYVLSTSINSRFEKIAAVHRWIKAQPDVQVDRIGVMGFTFGGGLALDYSIRYPGVAATATFSGVLGYGAPVSVSALRCPVLGIFAGNDPSILRSDVKVFEAEAAAAGVAYEVTLYEGQPQSFVSDMDTIRAGGAPGQAWDQFVRFFDRHLKQPRP